MDIMDMQLTAQLGGKKNRIPETEKKRGTVTGGEIVKK
jgi:hypothetical protein